MTRLRGETETAIEFARDVASRERLVAERAQVLELIRKSRIYETSLPTPDVAEFQ